VYVFGGGGGEGWIGITRLQVLQCGETCELPHAHSKNQRQKDRPAVPEVLKMPALIRLQVHCIHMQPLGDSLVIFTALRVKGLKSGLLHP